MPRSKKWPWTPSCGLVAGRTFANNREYRTALEEANRKNRRVDHAERYLLATWRAMDNEGRLHAAMRFRHTLDRLMVTTAVEIEELQLRLPW